MSCIVKKIWFWLCLKIKVFGIVLKFMYVVLCRLWFQQRRERSLYLGLPNLSFLSFAIELLCSLSVCMAEVYRRIRDGDITEHAM